MKNKALTISRRFVRWPCVGVLLALPWLLTDCGSSSVSSSAGGGGGTPSATVSLDSSHQFQTVEGFGAEINQWSGAGGHHCAGHDTVPGSEKTKILDRLYTDLRLTGIRSFVEFQGPGGDFDKYQSLAPIYGQIQNILAANSDQPTYNFVAVVTPAFRDATGRLASDGATRYASWAAKGLTKLKNQYGIVVNHWGIVNEPDGSGSISPSELKQLVAATGAAFRNAGLTTQIAVPQTVVVGHVQNYAPSILSDPSTLQYVKQLDYHEYDYDASLGQSPDIADRHAIRDLAKQYGLTLAMRETSGDVKQNRTTFWNGTYDQGMAWVNDVMSDMVDANAGAWDVILAYNVRNTPNFGVGSYVVMDYKNCTYTGFELPPHYWTLRQFVKYVRPGAVRVGASSSSHDVRAAAFVDSKRRQTVIVAVNNNASTDLAVTFTGTPNGSVAVSTVTQTTVNNASQGQGGAQTSQATAQNNQLTATLPARSVTTFVLGP